MGEWDVELDQPHGYGVMTWDNGITYKGEWAAGAYHGSGHKMCLCLLSTLCSVLCLSPCLSLYLSLSLYLCLSLCCYAPYDLCSSLCAMPLPMRYAPSLEPTTDPDMKCASVN